MLYCDRRVAGLETWSVSKPKSEDMVIPEIIRKCVAYIGFTDYGTGRHDWRGTAMLVARLIEGGTEAFSYLVTAKHVITKIKDLGLPMTTIRLNISGGNSRVTQIPTAHWLYHPSDPSVDVAVYPIQDTEFLFGTDHRCYPVTPAELPDGLIIHREYGVGSNVFMTGFFSEHYGKHRNIPIIRVGNIAAMPEEPIATKLGPMYGYLIEARSIGGLSGSPVFVETQYLIKDRNGVTRLPEPMFNLLGIIHGHFDEDAPRSPDAVSEDIAIQRQINMGIAIVTPAQKIIEVIMQPKIAEREQREIEDRRKRHLPTMDTAEGGDTGFTKEDFESALKKVSRKTMPSRSDEEK